MLNLTERDKSLLQQFDLEPSKEEITLCLHCLSDAPIIHQYKWGIDLRIFINGVELDNWWKESTEIPDFVKESHSRGLSPFITINCKPKDVIFLMFALAPTFEKAWHSVGKDAIEGDHMTVKTIFNKALDNHIAILENAVSGLEVGDSGLYYCRVPDNASGRADIYMNRRDHKQIYRIGTARGWVQRG